MAKTILGRVTFIPRGRYAEPEEYNRLDLVFHLGGSYVCLKDKTKGVTPGTDDATWMIMAEKGAAAWGDMTPEEKTEAASELGKELFGFVPVLLTENEFEHLGDRIDPDTMYYVLEE